MGYKLNNLYDDPYTMCVCTLISQYTTPEVQRMMADDDFVRRIILKETRLTDFQGPFLDAIVQSILDDKRRMELMHEIDKLSDYFYKNLDIERFRDTVRYIDNKYGFGIVEE